MNIRGEYRDVLRKNGLIFEDRGWRSNTIVADYGRFLASLMKKDFSIPVGIEYMAVGEGLGDVETFKQRVEDLFNSGELNKPSGEEGKRVWVKKIEPENIKYLDSENNAVESDSTITNRLRIETTFAKEEPDISGTPFLLKEFALLGIEEKIIDIEGNPTSTFDTNKMFFINHVDHDLITKDKSMEFNRTVILTFPLGGEDIN
ncbi:MAG: hypothetical protein AB3K77_13355 [Methanosarcinaceae archaeon]